jgi:hypothetical protein
MKSFMIKASGAALLVALAVGLAPTAVMAQSCNDGLVAAGVGNGNIDMSTIKGAPNAKIHVLPDCSRVDVATQLSAHGETAMTELISGNPRLLAALHSDGYEPADVDALTLFVARN